MEAPLVIQTPRPSDTLPVPCMLLLSDGGAEWGCTEDCEGVAFEREGFGTGARLAYSIQAAVDRRSPAIGDLLGDFLRLHDASDADVLGFASAWGTLGICDEHGAPITHGCNKLRLLGERCFFKVAADGHNLRCRNELRRLSWSPLLDGAAAWAWEPLHVWRDYARLFRAILRASARLGAGEARSARDWSTIDEVTWRLWGGIDLEAVIDEVGRDGYAAVGALDIARQRDALAVAVDWLLGFADFTPRVVWRPGASAPTVEMYLDPPDLTDMPATGRLFPALVTQLCAALSSPLGVYQCDECGAPFTPQKRRPRADRRRYCQPCSLDASLASKREWWRRNRSTAACNGGQAERAKAQA